MITSKKIRIRPEISKLRMKRGHLRHLPKSFVAELNKGQDMWVTPEELEWIKDGFLILDKPEKPEESTSQLVAKGVDGPSYTGAKTSPKKKVLKKSTNESKGD